MVISDPHFMGARVFYFSWKFGVRRGTSIFFFFFFQNSWDLLRNFFLGEFQILLLLFPPFPPLLFLCCFLFGFFKPLFWGTFLSWSSPVSTALSFLCIWFMMMICQLVDYLLWRSFNGGIGSPPFSSLILTVLLLGLFFLGVWFISLIPFLVLLGFFDFRFLVHFYRFRSRNSTLTLLLGFWILALLPDSSVFFHYLINP